MDLKERTTFYLINSSGKLISKAYEYQEIKDKMESYKPLDIELKMNHAILGKKNGSVILMEREFEERDKTDYLSLFKRLFPGDFE